MTIAISGEDQSQEFKILKHQISLASHVKIKLLNQKKLGTNQKFLPPLFFLLSLLLLLFLQFLV